MFVNPESAENVMSILKVARDGLAARAKLSEIDQSVLASLNDAIAELLPKPFKEYKDIQQAVGNYVIYRDMLGIERKAFEDHERDIKDEMTRISMWLRDRGDELGVDSFNTPYGTAYRNVKTSYRVETWDDFAEWIMQTNNMQCVEKRPAKLAVKEIFDTTGQLPPGLNEFIEVEFNVRRPTKSKS